MPNCIITHGSMKTLPSSSCLSVSRAYIAGVCFALSRRHSLSSIDDATTPFFVQVHFPSLCCEKDFPGVVWDRSREDINDLVEAAYDMTHIRNTAETTQKSDLLQCFTMINLKLIPNTDSIA